MGFSFDCYLELKDYNFFIDTWVTKTLDLKIHGWIQTTSNNVNVHKNNHFLSCTGCPRNFFALFWKAVVPMNKSWVCFGILSFKMHIIAFLYLLRGQRYLSLKLPTPPKKVNSVKWLHSSISRAAASYFKLPCSCGTAALLVPPRQSALNRQ